MQTSHPLFIVCGLFAFLLCACAPFDYKLIRTRESTVCERSHTYRPDWVNKLDTVDVSQESYFVGMASNVGPFSLAHGKQVAIADAEQQALCYVETKTKVELFKRAEHTDTTITFTSRAQLPTTNVKDVYYEKRELPNGRKYYDIYALVAYKTALLEQERQRLSSSAPMPEYRIKHETYEAQEEFNDEGDDDLRTRSIWYGILTILFGRGPATVNGQAADAGEFKKRQDIRRMIELDNN